MGGRTVEGRRVSEDFGGPRPRNMSQRPAKARDDPRRSAGGSRNRTEGFKGERAGGDGNGNRGHPRKSSRRFGTQRGTDDGDRNGASSSNSTRQFRDGRRNDRPGDQIKSGRRPSTKPAGKQLEEQRTSGWSREGLSTNKSPSTRAGGRPGAASEFRRPDKKHDGRPTRGAAGKRSAERSDRGSPSDSRRPSKNFDDPRTRVGGRGTRRDSFQQQPRTGAPGPGTKRDSFQHQPGQGRDLPRQTGRSPSPNSDLSKEWVNELRNTSRDPARAMDTVSEALEAFELEQYEKAARLADQAKELANRSSLVRELLGLCYYRLERWQDAVRELMTFRRFTGSLDENHVIADCYRALGRPDRALEICREVSRQQVSAETWAELCIVAAGAHADRDELDQALHYLARADDHPRAVQAHDLKVWYVKADLLERAGRKKEARKVWEEIVSVNPGFFDASQRVRA